MTPHFSLIRRSLALALGGALTLLAAAPPIVSANGIGDLYATARSGVLELHVASAKVVGRVDMKVAPSGLAFSNDGHSLYVASNTTQVSLIDIASLQLTGSVTMPIDVTNVAIPQGQTLVAAGPARTHLLFASLDDGSIRDVGKLPGAPDLLAGDRHDRRAMAARTGASWVAIADVLTRAVSTLDVGGKVVGLAVDRAGDAGYAVTTAPNELVRIRFSDAKVAWRVTLPGAPTAVVSTSFGPIVAGAEALWTSDGVTARRWAGEGSPAGILAASDGGDFVYLGQGDHVLALGGDAKVAATVPLPANETLRGLAAFPARGSLTARTGSASGGTVKIKPPETSTISALVRDWMRGPIPLAGAAAVFVVILSAGLILVRRLIPAD